MNEHQYHFCARIVCLVAYACICTGGAFATDVPAGFHRVAEDDCGSAGSQPRLVRGASWAITADEYDLSVIPDPRLKRFNHGDEVVYRYEGLLPEADYKLRVFYYNVVHPRQQRLLVDGVELHPAASLPPGEPVIRTLDLPKAVYQDSVVEVVFEKTGGISALVSAMEIWSDEPALLQAEGPMMRFRITSLSEKGHVTFSARMKIHRSPWNTGPVSFHPDGGIGKPQPHQKIGFTPWYDLRKLPGFGGECSMILDITQGAEGTIQFSRFPEAGILQREIDWNEPDGRRISFQGFGNIQTFRDHERANYLLTLEKANGQLFPLARPPLLFANAWGYTTGGAAEYMVKTFRLLGFNSVATSADAGKYETLYGWGSAAGHYWPPLYFPGLWGIRDEPTAGAMYDRYYRNYFSRDQWTGGHEDLRSFQLCDEPKEQEFNSPDEANAEFRVWLEAHGLEPEFFGVNAWADVNLRRQAGASGADKRLYYWSRKYRAYATPKMFAMAARSCRVAAPGTDTKAFVALSGHHFSMESQMPLDMFQLAAYPDLTPGISDWMTTGSWWWDSHQAVAFSLAPFNAGARRYGADFGKPPLTFPMMHCVNPSLFRAFTQLANQCKLISYYNYGPSYEVTEGYWSGSAWAHEGVQRVNNQAARVDDILGPGVMRPSRVAMLYAMSTEIWWPGSSFADKRAAFLALSHEYFQPELVTEEQIEAGALAHYDALYVLDSHVARATQEAIGAWVRRGGLLWTCSEALVRDEYGEHCDVLQSAGLKRVFGQAVSGTALHVTPEGGESGLRSQTVPPDGRPESLTWDGARIRARYGDGMPAWLEGNFGQGKIVYLGHRAGLAYSRRAGKRGEFAAWPADGRVPLVRPLLEAGVERELTLSTPLVMAQPLSTEAGTVVVLYNMNSHEPDDVIVTLKEPARPHRVQWFDAECNLVALPFDHADGQLRVRLPRLHWQGSFLIVRRTPEPADERFIHMHTATGKNLASGDWQALSAGAWFAGFFPEWRLAPLLVPLLEHDHWAVRRSAAESIGRLEYRTAAEALHTAARRERDPHVLADMTHALTRLGHPAALAFQQRLRESDNPILRAEFER